jgi:hypothetical protein
LSRFNWLNSTVGINEEITKGYPPVKVENNRITILGRNLSITKNGLPATITSYFGPSNQSLVEKGEPVVDHPFRFIVEMENGEIPDFKTANENIDIENLTIPRGKGYLILITEKN